MRGYDEKWLREVKEAGEADGLNGSESYVRELGTLTVCLSIARTHSSKNAPLLKHLEKRVDELTNVLYHASHVYSQRLQDFRKQFPTGAFGYPIETEDDE